MAIRTNTEILEAIRERLGEDHSDDALGLIEDISDTLADKDVLSANGALWKSKYEENDAAWRKKYHDRFFQPTSDDDVPVLEPKREDGCFWPNDNINFWIIF